MLLRGGRYELPKALVFTGADGGFGIYPTDGSESIARIQPNGGQTLRCHVNTTSGFVNWSAGCQNIQSWNHYTFTCDGVEMNIYPLFLWLDPLAIFHGFLNAWRQPIALTTLLTGLALPLLLLLDLAAPRLWCQRVCPLGAAQDLLPHPRRWLREGKTHGGAIYVSSRFRQNELRALVRALVAFLKAHGDEDWSCREGWL